MVATESTAIWNRLLRCLRTRPRRPSLVAFTPTGILSQ